MATGVEAAWSSSQSPMAREYTRGEHGLFTGSIGGLGSPTRELSTGEMKGLTDYVNGDSVDFNRALRKGDLKATEWKSVRVAAEDVEVAINPSRDDIERMLAEQPRHASVRIIKTPDNVYAWNGNQALHDEMITALGLKETEVASVGWREEVNRKSELNSAYMRDVVRDSSSSRDAQIERLDSATTLQTFTREVTVYRGLNNDQIAHMGSGDHFVDKGYIDALPSAKLAATGKTKAIMAIKVPAGTTAVDLRAVDVTPSYGSQQLLFGRGKTLTATGRKSGYLVPVYEFTMSD